MRIREAVAVAAPATAVFDALHVDLAAAERWSSGRLSMASVDGSRPGPSSLIRYDVRLPGGLSTRLVARIDELDPPRRCAGRFVEGPIRGEWAYDYTERAGRTRVVYQLEFAVPGALGPVARLFKGRYAAAIREGLEAVRDHVEAGPPEA